MLPARPVVDVWSDDGSLYLLVAHLGYSPAAIVSAFNIVAVVHEYYAVVNLCVAVILRYDDVRWHRACPGERALVDVSAR